MRRALMLTILGLMMLGGCSDKTLETGYVYTPLGDSPTKRRGYYADPFSPEARQAQQERQQNAEERRVVPGQ